MAESEPRHGNVRVNGLRLDYLEWGDPQGELMVLLHGFASSTWTTWRDTAPRFVDRFRVVGVDLRGHGGSDWDPNANYTLQGYLDDTEAALDALGLKPRVIIAHSLGGRIALLHAARNPTAMERLVIIDTKITGGRRQPDVLAERPVTFANVAESAAYASQLHGRRRHRFDHELVVREDGSVTWRHDLAGIKRSRTKPDRLLEQGQWREFAALRAATLVIKAGRSGTISRDDVAKMAELNPAVRLVEYETAGHSAHQDEPERFCADVSSFLA
jgi:non-heme chloroperoxidase